MYKFLTKAAEFASKLLDFIIISAIILLLLFGVYSMYDIYSLFQDSELTDAVLQYKPTVVEVNELPQDNSLTFDELQSVNSDVCAWITITNTKIDYPIVISKDNMDYLNVNVLGEYSLSGSIFCDHRNNSDFTDQVTLVYGHNMNDYAMFGEIPSFASSSTFSSKQDGLLFLPNATYKLKVMAYIEVQEGNREIYSVQYINSRAANDYISYISQNAEHYRDLSQYAGDRYLALSTCSSESTNGRCLLILKILDDQNGG